MFIVEVRMKVWIAFHGYDYEGSDVIGVYATFRAARGACIERIDGEDGFHIEDKNEKFYAAGRSQTYSVYPYDVEG